MITGLPALLTGPLAGRAAVYDRDAAPDATGPSVWITDGPTTYTGRPISAAARGRTDTARLVCSSSSATGASNLAHFVAGLLDGAHLNGQPLRVPLVTEVLEDRTDPSEYCWSASVDLERTTPRGTNP